MRPQGLPRGRDQQGRVRLPRPLHGQVLRGVHEDERAHADVRAADAGGPDGRHEISSLVSHYFLLLHERLRPVTFAIKERMGRGSVGWRVLTCTLDEEVSGHPKEGRPGVIRRG